MRMRELIGTSMLAGALALAGTSVALADDTTQSAADDRLEERVEKRLEADDRLGHLEADVSAGVATLRGEVASLAEKGKAERLARAAGAKKVINLLEVDADKAVARIRDRAEAKKAQIDERAEKAKDAVDRQAEVAKNRVEANPDPNKRPPAAATDPARKPDKEVFDPLVTAKVKTKIIKDDLLDKSEINVDSDSDGVVTLKGWVPTEAARGRALELARTTEGVRKVVDKLEVKAPIVK